MLGWRRLGLVAAAVSAVIVAALLLGACGEAAPEHPTTGIDVVDEVIAAVDDRDTDELVSLARDGVMPDLGWATTDGECHTLAVDDPTEIVSAFVAAGPTLYGVFAGPDIPADAEMRIPAAWTRGDYWLVYSLPLEAGEFTNPGARLHVAEDGAIVGLWVPCRGVPEWLSYWDEERLQEIDVAHPETPEAGEES